MSLSTIFLKLPTSSIWIPRAAAPLLFSPPPFLHATNLIYHQSPPNLSMPHGWCCQYHDGSLYFPEHFLEQILGFFRFIVQFSFFLNKGPHMGRLEPMTSAPAGRRASHCATTSPLPVTTFCAVTSITFKKLRSTEALPSLPSVWDRLTYQIGAPAHIKRYQILVQ